MSSALSWELFKPFSHLKAAGNAAVSLFMLMLPTSYQAASHNDLGSWIFLHSPSLKHQHHLNSISKWTSTNNTDTATLINHNRNIISLLILRSTLQSGFLLVPQSPPIIKELRLRPLVQSRLKILYIDTIILVIGDGGDVYLEVVGLNAPDHHPGQLLVKGELRLQANAVLVVVRNPTISSNLNFEDGEPIMVVLIICQKVLWLRHTSWRQYCHDSIFVILYFFTSSKCRNSEIKIWAYGIGIKVRSCHEKW